MVIFLQFTLQKETRAKNPDSKVSRNITFRVQEDISPKKKKKRVRRPDPEDENDFGENIIYKIQNNCCCFCVFF